MVQRRKENSPVIWGYDASFRRITGKLSREFPTYVYSRKSARFLGQVYTVPKAVQKKCLNWSARGHFPVYVRISRLLYRLGNISSNCFLASFTILFHEQADPLTSTGCCGVEVRILFRSSRVSKIGFIQYLPNFWGNIRLEQGTLHSKISSPGDLLPGIPGKSALLLGLCILFPRAWILISLRVSKTTIK